MKKILVVLALVMSAVVGMGQEMVKVTTNDGKVIAGQFVDGSEELFTIKTSDQYIVNKYGNDTIIFRLEDLKEVYMYNQTFVPHEGRLVAKKSLGSISKATPIVTQEMEYISKGEKKVVYSSAPQHPNYAIGKALKSTGGVAIGVGVPCLLAGTILTAVGGSATKVDLGNRYMSDKELVDKMLEVGNKETSKGRTLTAGCVLLPIGASLTIVGVPLYVHGKKIMTTNFNYTGNGVGVGVEF